MEGREAQESLGRCSKGQRHGKARAGVFSFPGGLVCLLGAVCAQHVSAEGGMPRPCLWKFPNTGRWALFSAFHGQGCGLGGIHSLVSSP